MMCSSFHRTINFWMIFQSVYFHINLNTSHVWSKYQHSNTSYKHPTPPWMPCLSLHHYHHSISVSYLLIVSHSLVSISHSLNPLILIHMCLHSSHPTTHNHEHVLLSLLINDKVSTTFSLSLPSHHKQGLECLLKLIVSDGMFLSFKNHTSFSSPFSPSFSLVFSLFCLSVPHFDANTLPFPFLPQSVVCF